jgi:hypothetical protein
MREIFWGKSLVKNGAGGGTGDIVQRDGESFYKIENYHGMPPFFMALVSGSEHWMFLSSTGGLTCGRRNPDSALFPYETDDKIHDASPTTGPRTILQVERRGKHHLWLPFSRGVQIYEVERNLYKNLPGNKLVFEEINQDLGLTFSYGWSSSERFGFVKTSRIGNDTDAECAIHVLDGLCNVLPFGVTRQTQTELSTLLDAYKQAERVAGLSAGIFTLSSILTDRAEPCEALKATVVWSIGLDEPDILLSQDQLAAFCSGAPVKSEPFVKGKRGAFLAQSSFSLAPGDQKTWHIVADVNQGPARLAALLQEMRQGISPATVEADIEAGTQRLLQLVGAADGRQFSSDNLATARHFSNTLFNIMRGGTFYDGYHFPLDDFLGFVETWNKPLRARFAELLDAQQGPLTLAEAARIARSSGDADLERLALEYLPLTFSRRHGDPSRPWNEFSIDIKNADGSDRLYYQGNWRDIFQNWEALSLCYPEYVESFIAKFVNASTADGYNPYRITKSGIDWEVLEPENSWSNIGYWGDHQINYLGRLLELSNKYHPGKIANLLGREAFVYAHVPYRIKGYQALLSDPRDTVIYDDAQAEAIARRVDALGSDGKLHALHDGSIYKVNLLEKLLIPVLSKIGNFVPGGGIWMNTQRPEWNDANNALVGYGLSMVTLCYLRRYLILLADLLNEDSAQGYAVSVEVLSFFRALDQVLQENKAMLSSEIKPEQRKAIVDGLGTSGEDYRETVYAGFAGEKSPIEKSEILRFIALALQYFNHSIAANRRPDGLFHSYNLVHFADPGYEVEQLSEMLEGQVAVLSSGYLEPRESAALLESLRASRMYRSDQNSYTLYPDKAQASYLEKNVIPPSAVEQNSWIREELESGSDDFIEQDVNGRVHFKDTFRNVRELALALKNQPRIGKQDAAAMCHLYEKVFRHRQFTGRSGSMYKYEGLGCIYWHMVSKLLLATAEVIVGAARNHTDKATMDKLLERFDDIKEGLGMHKTPAEYGAFPTDPYSHTPGFAGVQQPGMTGQVKEDVITRFMELGVSVEQGRVSFAPTLLRLDEFTTEAATWGHAAGSASTDEALEAGSLAFSLCAVPVIYRLAEQSGITVFAADGSHEAIEGNELGAAWSHSLFQRDGRIQKIAVDIPRNALR